MSRVSAIAITYFKRGIMTNIEVEDLSPVKKKITFEVEEEKVLSVIDSEYQNLKKTVQIKGFRKGKVPLNIIRSYFKGKVEADAVRKVIDETFEPALTERDIKPVSVLAVEPDAIETGKPFRYTAEIEVVPAFEINDYKSLKLTKQVRVVTDADVDKRIDDLRKMNAKLVPMTHSDGVKQGDYLLLDIEASADGERIPPLCVKDYHVEVGRNFYLPGFDAELLGMRPEESREIVMEFPADFPRKNLSGKTGTFSVACKEAKEQVLPELDDDFAKDLGGETLNELRERVGKELRDVAAFETETKIKNQIIDQLIEKHSFDVPDSLVEQEINQLLSQLIRDYAARGMDLERLPMPSPAQRDQIRPGATRAVRTRLILDSIVEQEKLELTDDEFQSSVAEQAGKAGVSVDHFQDRLAQEEVLQAFRKALLDEKVYKLIEDSSEIVEEPIEVEGDDSQASNE